ncbi:SCP domain-containing protein [Psidium guajava]|nr:SCP domain-containing protein [Psidium guajava]
MTGSFYRDCLKLHEFYKDLLQIWFTIFSFSRIRGDAMNF